MSLQLKGDGLRSALSKLRVCLVEKKKDAEICDKLGLSWEELLDLKRKFFDGEAEILRGRSTEHTYVRYVLEQRQCMADLDAVIAEKDKGNSSYVSAVRAKSDILDKVLKTGVELGLIQRLADGGGYAAGEAIKSMNNKDFRVYIVQEIQVLNQMMVRYGDTSIMDVEVGPIYQKKLQPKTPVKGHSRTKIFGGRRLVKGNES